MQKWWRFFKPVYPSVNGNGASVELLETEISSYVTGTFASILHNLNPAVVFSVRVETYEQKKERKIQQNPLVRFRT